MAIQIQSAALFGQAKLLHNLSESLRCLGNASAGSEQNIHRIVAPFARERLCLGEVAQELLAKVVELQQPQLELVERHNALIIKKAALKSGPVVSIYGLSDDPQKHCEVLKRSLIEWQCFEFLYAAFDHGRRRASVKKERQTRIPCRLLAPLVPLKLITTMAICFISEPARAKTNQACKDCGDPISDVPCVKAFQGNVASDQYHCHQNRAKYGRDCARNCSIATGDSVTLLVTHTPPYGVLVSRGILA
ncbi:hypothetical protein JAK38_11735 [Stenotrophomonas maltophilia]|nr:hypothetical protein [Stenotrophomonas maltophilia]